MCNLVMDEMKIKKKIKLVNGKEYCYIDVGHAATNSTNLPEVKNVLVVMAVCDNDNQKVPVSYYFVRSLMDNEKAEIVKKI